jgi:hypothetical protein
MHLRLAGGSAYTARSGASVLSDCVSSAASGGAAARGRPPQAAARRAGLEVVEKLLTAMIWVVSSGAGLTRRLTGLVP